MTRRIRPHLLSQNNRKESLFKINRFTTRILIDFSPLSGRGPEFLLQARAGQHLEQGNVGPSFRVPEASEASRLLINRLIQDRFELREAGSDHGGLDVVFGPQRLELFHNLEASRRVAKEPLTLANLFQVRATLSPILLYLGCLSC